MIPIEFSPPNMNMHTHQSVANGTVNCLSIFTLHCTFILYATLYSTSATLPLKDSHTVITLCEMIAWKDAIASFQWLLRFPPKGIIRFSTVCRLALRSPTYLCKCSSGIADFFLTLRFLLLLINQSVTWRTLAILGFCLILVLGGRTHPFFMVYAYHHWLIGPFPIHQKEICLSILQPFFSAPILIMLSSTNKLHVMCFKTALSFSSKFQQFVGVPSEAHCSWGRGEDYFLLSLCEILTTILKTLKKAHIQGFT